MHKRNIWINLSYTLPPRMPSKASTAPQSRPNIGRNSDYTPAASAPSATRSDILTPVPPAMAASDLTREQADFLQNLQQRSSAVAYLLPPALGHPLISMTKTPNGLSARLLVVYEDNADYKQVVVVVGPDKEATVWLLRRLLGSTNKEKVITRQTRKASFLWLAVGCIVFGVIGLFVAWARAEAVGMVVMNLID